ncbi:hypothetical protein OEZ86_013881 [Tetradesmus obliquus]|nr:hypothetical protein OEZ86_013881 [Tetradesmus obliquus]
MGKAPVQARAEALLKGALFHKVRSSEKLVQKVHVVAGDISLPGLGLSDADRATLLHSVDYIIHCAADIRLEADMQETLSANFEGTRKVLELAAAAGHLKALVHVSSAFVNMNQPRSSIVDEQVYPLKYGHQAVDVEELAQELLAVPKPDANSRAATLLQRWHFPNTYTLGKHMSEQLVARYQAKQQLPVAIVRPSLVSAIAGEPYPGYAGNWAGPIGGAAAMAIGMFDCLDEDPQSDSMGGEHAALPLLIVHAATSSSYPLVLSEGWNTNLDFLQAHPPPFRISFKHPGRMDATFEPSDAAVLSHRRSMGRRVRTVAALLRLVGRTREAKKLQVGYETFCVVNNSKTDKDLTFSTRALVALEAALAPGDASDYLLVWRPATGRTGGSSSEAEQQLQGGEAAGAAAAAAAVGM